MEKDQKKKKERKLKKIKKKKERWGHDLYKDQHIIFLEVKSLTLLSIFPLNITSYWCFQECNNYPERS